MQDDPAVPNSSERRAPVRQLARSFGFAFRGLAALVRHEPNARIHAAAATAVIACGAVFGLAAWEWVAIVLCIAGVFAAELFNTSLENACDAVSLRESAFIRTAKDCAAAGVLVCASASVTVGLIIFLPRIADAVAGHAERGAPPASAASF